MDFDSGKWQEMSLPEQLGNAGSDFERALRWKEKGQIQLFTKAANRTLEQLDLTLTDKRWTSYRRQEIARLREETCRSLFTGENNKPAGLQKYFLSMATLARK
jgi:hypothetical protein